MNTTALIVKGTTITEQNIVQVETGTNELKLPAYILSIAIASVKTRTNLNLCCDYKYTWPCTCMNNRIWGLKQL